MGNICSNMEEEYNSELKHGVGNDLVKDARYDFASVDFREAFYPQMIGQDFWSIALQKRHCKEGDKDACISYQSMRRYLRKSYFAITDADIDALYSTVMPVVRRTRAINSELKQERVDLMSFIRLSYLFYRFYDIIEYPPKWLFYWADTFYTGYASLTLVQTLIAFAYQFGKKEMRYLFRMVHNIEGWIGQDQWAVLLEGLESLGKISKSNQVYVNQEKRAAAFKRQREKSMAEKEAAERNIEGVVEQAAEPPGNAGGNNWNTEIEEGNADTQPAVLSRQNLNILNKRAFLLTQGMSGKKVDQLLKLQTSSTGALIQRHHESMQHTSRLSKRSASEKKGGTETEVVGMSMVLTPVREES